MPYSDEEDKSLPDNVKNLSVNKRKQWVSVFNSTINKGGTEEEAFTKANGVVLNSKIKGYVEFLYDLTKRQLNQDEAKYSAFGASGSSGCASCNWFVSPDSCILVRGDINPSGICAYYLSKVSVHVAPPQVEMMQMQVTPVSQVTDNIVTQLMNAIKEFLHLPATTVTLPVNKAPVQTPLVFIKQDNGIRFFTIFTNCFKDSEKETIYASAHKEYVDWVTKSNLYPELHLWHAGPKSKWGKVDWVDYVDGFVCASGMVDGDKHHIVEALQKESIVAMSHGFIGLINNEGDIVRYKTWELSPLPKWAAANIWTSFNISKENNMPFTDKKRKWLKDIAGVSDETIVIWEQSIDSLASHVKSLGLEFKEADEGMTNEIARLTKTVSDLAKTLLEQKSTIEALQKGWDEKIHEAFLSEISKSPNAFVPSTDKDNIIESKKNDDLSWFGEIILEEKAHGVNS